MANLILLGAGASFGSQPTNAPPLGKDLFKAIEASNQKVSSFPQHIKDLFNGDFETGMVELSMKYPNSYTKVLQRAMAGYLAGFVPDEKSLYRKLLANIKLKRVVFCTLNYDLLIEESGLALQKTVGYFSTSKDDVKIIKPHGSSNFWLDVGDSIVRGLSVSSGVPNGNEVDGDVIALRQSAAIARANGDSGLCPTMAFYAPGKHVTWCARFIQHHQDDWKQCALSAKKIFISGVQINTVDSHIWDAVADTDADVYFYGDEEAKIGFNLWRDSIGKKNLYFLKGHFDYAVEDIIKKLKK